MHVSKLLHLCKEYGLKELSPISPLDIALVHHTHVTSN